MSVCINRYNEYICNSTITHNCFSRWVEIHCVSHMLGGNALPLHQIRYVWSIIFHLAMLAFRIGQHTFALMGFFINRCIRCAYKWTWWTGNDLFLINNKTILCYLYLLHMTLRVLWISNTGNICKLKSNLPILLSANIRYEGHYTGSKLRSVNLPPDMMLLGIGDSGPNEPPDRPNSSSLVPVLGFIRGI